MPSFRASSSGRIEGLLCLPSRLHLGDDFVFGSAFLALVVFHLRDDFTFAFPALGLHLRDDFKGLLCVP